MIDFLAAAVLAAVLIKAITRRLERDEHRNPTARQKRGDLSLWWLAVPVAFGVAAGLWSQGYMDVGRWVAAVTVGLPFALARVSFWAKALRVDVGYDEISVEAMEMGR